jgi:hypothetical protein
MEHLRFCLKFRVLQRQTCRRLTRLAHGQNQPEILRNIKLNCGLAVGQAQEDKAAAVQLTQVVAVVAAIIISQVSFQNLAQLKLSLLVSVGHQEHRQIVSALLAEILYLHALIQHPLLFMAVAAVILI